ncbi:MAG TPA: gamma-glutamyl-gamma-aminobutyrate hydrolase family protein [Acidimicrobiales bacterium]|nr:gamma-glutamyl-gamma-aminobutyrate hydrolase family protein [Acidimicrobiales bacterium]
MRTLTVAVLIGRQPEGRYSVHRAYADALSEVGAVPLLLVPPTRPEAVDSIVSVAMACDAVCLTGGGDVEPARYGEEPAAALMEVDPARDDTEAAVLLSARQSGRPVLGICRGIQVMAAALGGNLHQDLPGAGLSGHWEEDRQYEPVHRVTADPSTLACAALAGAEQVNSIHHQAVRDPGPHLRATAWSDDGTIEAIEADGLLGVQWHPERLIAHDARHLAPFRWLVAA